MTPQELKNSILQLAIQGKLVEQRPEEGTAAELLEKILAAKGNLTRRRGGAEDMSGGSRSCATGSRAACRASSVPDVSVVPFVPSVPDDEKPFDIPENWEWVRIGDVFNLQAGKNVKSEDIHQEYSPEHKYKCYGGNGCRGYVADYNRSGHHVLIGRQGALCGNINYAEGDFYATEHAVVVEQFAGTDVYWCGYFLDALNLNRYATATAQPGLAVAKVNQVPIPLPPLAEQKRIVAKIEELLPLIDRYEKAWSKLEDFNKRFPVDMQKSLLQMAIQGKLVDQRPEEGTGEELLEKILATKNAKGAKKNLTRSRGARGEKNTSALSASPREEISDDEKPFDIPESWVWVRLESATDMLAGFAFKSTDFKTEGKYRLMRGINLGVSNIRWKDTVYVDSMTERIAEYRLKSGDVLIGLDRPWISDGTRVAIFDDSKETYLVQRVLRLRETGLLTSAFIALLLRSSLLSNSIGDKTTGISVPHISPGQVGNLVVPLPPLAEQKRIVAKLEEILPLCERLK